MTKVAKQRLVAGSVELGAVMTHLAAARPVFHSEADLQFGFARAMFEIAPEVRVRLEVPQRSVPGRREYLDMLCLGTSGATTAVEFKYFTRAWNRQVGDDHYDLRDHAATDLARLYFLRDVARLERGRATTGGEGLAVMLSNEGRLWKEPKLRSRPNNDRAFQIHDGQTLTGTLRWATGENQVDLLGSYTTSWHDYSAPEPGHPSGQFRWLALWVGNGLADVHGGR